jgi:hypothetical protein
MSISGKLSTGGCAFLSSGTNVRRLVDFLASFPSSFVLSCLVGRGRLPQLLVKCSSETLLSCISATLISFYSVDSEAKSDGPKLTACRVDEINAVIFLALIVSEGSVFYRLYI